MARQTKRCFRCELPIDNNRRLKTSGKRKNGSRWYVCEECHAAWLEIQRLDGAFREAVTRDA